MLGPSSTDLYWEKRYQRDFHIQLDWRWAIYSSKVWRTFLGLVSRGSRGLDLGAGGGNLTRVLLASGCRCHAIELSVGGVSTMRASIPAGYIIQGNTLHIPVGEGCVDFVVSSMVIEHVDDARMASECFRVLRPGGIGMITSVLRKWYGWYWRRNHAGEMVMDETHLREYRSIAQFSEVFSKAGFEVVFCEAPPIRFGLIDPVFKLLYRFFPSEYLRGFPSTRLGNALRLVSRCPVPGYSAVEIIVRKPI